MGRLALIVCLVMGCSDESEDEVTAKPCVELRDHVIGLKLADATQVDRDAHRAAMRRALGDEFVTQCQTAMTETQITCALRAADSGALTACVATR